MSLPKAILDKFNVISEAFDFHYPDGGMDLEIKDFFKTLSENDIRLFFASQDYSQTDLDNLKFQKLSLESLNEVFNHFFSGTLLDEELWCKNTFSEELMGYSNASIYLLDEDNFGWGFVLELLIRKKSGDTIVSFGWQFD